MKETFTIKEIRAIMDKAFEKAQFEIRDDDNVVAKELNKAWNRGVNSMYNNALVAMYQSCEGAN